jgi:hypothetical protein
MTITDSSALNTTNVFIGSDSIISASAGENLKDRDCVFIALENTSGKIGGYIYPTNNNYSYSSNKGWECGFTTGSASASSLTNIKIKGILDGFTGLTAGGVYYISNTAGSITKTKPDNNAKIVGIGLTSASLLINIRGDNLDPTSDISTCAYFMGGQTDNVATNLSEKLKFSTEIFTASTVSNLSSDKGNGGTCGNKTTHGYFAGGKGSGTIVSYIDKTVFSTDITSILAVSNLSVVRWRLTGLSDNGVTYGYFAGGETNSGVYTNIADRITFSNDVCEANTTSNISSAKYSLCGVSDGATYGYFSGGITNTTTGVVATTDRITFSTGTTAVNTVSNLSLARRDIGGLSNSSTYGYFFGGITGQYNVDTTYVSDRITFSTGVVAAMGSGYSQYNGNGYPAGASNYGYRGYLVSYGVVAYAFYYSIEEFMQTTGYNALTTTHSKGGISQNSI